MNIWTNIVSTICSLITTIVSVFMWTQITPEAVGQSLYVFLSYLYPALIFSLGFVFGWNLKRIIDIRKGNLINNPKQDKKSDELKNKKLKEERINQFKNESMGLKFAVVLMFDNGFCDENNDSYKWPNNIEMYATKETRLNCTRFTLKDWAKEMIEEEPYLIEHARNVMYGDE